MPRTIDKKNSVLSVGGVKYEKMSWVFVFYIINIMKTGKENHKKVQGFSVPIVISVKNRAGPRKKKSGEV